MVVCLCKGITEKKIEDLVDKGIPTHEVLKRLGVGSDCGICVIDAVQKIASRTNSKNNSLTTKNSKT
ncbi:MAG: (2Fe-2S)-binding protein [Bacteriovoracaceae bacterium]|nr:(2Fe-2S)-binding protein [Bacteriovoracaceae bacterium]